MPELPEVETIRRQLEEVIVGKKISKVEVLREKSFSGDPKKLRGWEIESIGRKAKVIEIFFKDKKEMMIVHLKMTGQLVFIKNQKLKKSKPCLPAGRTQNKDDISKERIIGGHPSPDWVKDLPSKHTRVVVDFSDGSKLFFNDMRVFGWMRILTKTQKLKTMPAGRQDSRTQAPDVVDRKFTLDYFGNILKRSKRAVKLVLMDQDKIGGMGNIYANDALYLAKVRPDRKANSLSSTEMKSLYEAVKEVINRGIKYGGASAADEKFVNISGLGGKYQDHFLVYQKAGEKCGECGEKIEKMKIGGRGTFFCPTCQM